MRYPAFALCLLLTACATKPEPEPVIRTVVQEVRVPVPVDCGPDVGPRPAYVATPEAIAAAQGIYQLGVLVVSELLQLRARNEVLETAQEACRSPRPG